MLGLDVILKVMVGTCRIGGLMLAMPALGAAQFPGPLKFLFAVSLGFILLPFQTPLPPVLWEQNGLLVLCMSREIGIGLFLGFCARFIFLVVTMSLETAGLQMGFAIANVFDPQNNSQISVLAQLGVVMTILFFFGANLHHDLFRALVKSYELLPIGLPDWNLAPFHKSVLGFLRSSFELSIRLAFPVLAAMLIIHVVMGIISRTAPQMNLFFNAAFALNIVAGLVLAALSFPEMMTQVQTYSRRMAAHGYGLW